jgi:lipopolysaccharide/colanic/teichoic acid biosynthesis glycosyltransferase
MYKLRTMHVGNETNNRKVTDSQDDRITSVGELLRRLKIDELPQFWNVLRGDMSIVGPRPEDWDIVNQHYTADQKRTLAVRPGITSAAEVRWYPDLTYHDPPPRGVSLQDWYLMRHLPLRLAEELHYLQNQSMLLDLKLIVQTIYRILVNSWISPRKRFVSPRGIKGSEMHADRDQPKGHHSRPQDIK